MLPPLPVLLAELVRRPSVNPMGRTDVPPELCFENRVVDYLEGLLRPLPVTVRRRPVAPGRDNLVAAYEPPDPWGRLLWEAHTDTVPADGMTVEPFAAAVAEGRLSGRGACDVKAGGAAMLSAFARLVRQNPPGAAAVTLAFTVDEEHTFLGVQALVADGIAADLAVVAEPTGLDLVVAHKGVVRWSVETRGRACHSSRPADGANAVYGMARLVRRLEDYADELARRPPHPGLGPPTLSVGVIQGGVSPNTVPDRCRIEIDRRLVPGEDPLAAVAECDAVLRAVGVPFASTVTFACPPLPERVPERLLARFGPRPRRGVPFATDASTLAEAGVPAVVFGPGDIAQAHTRDEWVELAQVAEAADILYRLACQPEPPTHYQ
jgi:acetylornithine deacetylase